MKDNTSKEEIPKGNKLSPLARYSLEAAGGAVPVVGGILSAVSSAWSDKEQDEVNKFFEYWINMLRDEIREKEATMIDILARINLQDERIKERVKSREYQSLVKKTFREWSAAESEEKRKMIRNILSNAASTDLSSDDVVRLFIDWLSNYSEFHFQVIGAIYNHSGITRGEVWENLERKEVREDSADADLYKLLFRDLSMGGIVRQHREVDYHGNFISKSRGKKRGSGSKTMKSAFDREEQYELTELGQQFVHYAMTDLPLRIDYKNPVDSNENMD